MSPDQAYQAGYDDGLAGKAANASMIFDENYSLGYEDGKGDHAATHAVNTEYVEFHEAPNGFEYTGEKRVPRAYEWYLSKQGNPTYLKRERKNNQTRHILRPTECVCGIEKKCGVHDDA